MNLMSFSLMIINYFVLLLTRYTCVNALNSRCEIKKDSRNIRKILNFLFRKKPKQNYLEKNYEVSSKVSAVTISG